MAQSPCFLLPLLIPFCPLSLFPLLTWNSPSCDRIRPPRSQVTRKLTSPFSTLSPFPIPSPLQIPSTQVNKRLTMMTSRIRLLLSGTSTTDTCTNDPSRYCPIMCVILELLNPCTILLVFFYALYELICFSLNQSRIQLIPALAKSCMCGINSSLVRLGKHDLLEFYSMCLPLLL